MNFDLLKLQREAILARKSALSMTWYRGQGLTINCTSTAPRPTNYCHHLNTLTFTSMDTVDPSKTYTRHANTLAISKVDELRAFRAYKRNPSHSQLRMCVN